MKMASVRTRAQNEDGIALVAAIIVLAVMFTMTVAMLSYTAGTARDATLQHARQRATDLAEAGVAQAAAQLASHYYDSSQQSVNTSTVYAPSWFTGTTTSQQSPTSSAACTSTSTCMSWSVVSCAFSTSVTGCTLDTTSYTGVTQGAVVLKGVGSVPNPTGASAIVKTVTEKITVSQPPTLVVTPNYWKEIYAGGTPSGNCDLTLGQGVAITAPLYVGGDLCLTNTATISGSNVDLKVFGWVWLRQSSKIGSSNGSTPKINTAQIAGGCTNLGVQPTMSSGCTINLATGAIWDLTPTSLHAPTAPTADPLPSVDWTKAQSQQANSTPAPSCTNGRSLSEANFALTPNASYSCTSAVGSITYTYNAGGTSTLSVSGSVYFSGNLSIDTQSGVVQYSGLGAFFVAGSVTGANNSYLCVKVASNSCDFANATNTGSSNYWDPTLSALLIQSQGAFNATNLRFQGGIYSATSISIGGGNGTTQGPLVTPGPMSIGQQLNGSFPNFPFIVGGSLGTTSPYSLSSPSGATY
jgi:Tfp pilus assembly protein PilX